MDKVSAEGVVHIQPRFLNVSEVSKTGKFTIKNLSEEKNLYFKIKRCEDVIPIDYNPKYGCVEAGDSLEINLNYVNGESNPSGKVRLYVKIVVLDFPDVEASFKANWQKGVDGKNTLKKLVEINTSKSNISSPTANESNRRFVVSPSLSVGNEDNLSILSESIDNFNYVGNGKKGGVSSEKKHDDNSTIDDGYSHLSDSVTTVNSTNSFAFASASQNKNLNSGISISQSRSSKEAAGASIFSLNKSVVQDVSCLSPLSSGSRSSGDMNNLVLQINGEAASNSVISDAISLRLTDSLTYSKQNAKSRIVSIEISNTPLSSLQFSICGIFQSSKHDDSHDDEVALMKRALLVDNIRSLSINNNFKLQYIDNSINSLSNLKYLDLSRNEIQTIASLINLPSLIGLNLSFNKLTSLDFLQLLISLQWLIVSNNNIGNLHNSVNLLIPLSKTLTTLDLSNNPVASQNNYVDEVFAILPNLKIFHSKNISNLKGFASSFHEDDDDAVSMADSTCSNSSFQNNWSNTSNSADRAFEYRIKRALKRLNVNEKRSVVQNEKINAVIASRNPTPVKSKPSSPSIKPPSNNLSSLKNNFSEPIIVSGSTEKSNVPFQYINSEVSNHNPSSNSKAGQKSNSTVPAYMQQTNDSKSRRKSQIGLLIDHWGSHKDQVAKSNSFTKIPVRAESPSNFSKISQRSESSLLQNTGSKKNRRKSFGIADADEVLIGTYNNSVSKSHNFVQLGGSNLDSSRGYFSDGETSSVRRSFRDSKMNIDSKTFMEMQEDPRYSKWHSRYRVPRPIFGFSKPFIDRPDFTLQWPRPTGWERETERVRNGFQKLRTGGTFTRASKGLPASFYPMDYEDVEAIQRQGFFHDTIGTVNRFQSPQSKKNASKDDSHVSYSGSVVIPGSAGKVERRASLGPHISRQYKSGQDTNPVDTFSDHNKWHNVSNLEAAASRRKSVSASNLGLQNESSQNVSSILPSTPHFVPQNYNQSSNFNTMAKLFGNSDMSDIESNRSANSNDAHLENKQTAGNNNTADEENNEEAKLLAYMKWLDTAAMLNAETEKNSAISNNNGSSSPSLHDLASETYR